MSAFKTLFEIGDEVFFVDTAYKKVIKGKVESRRIATIESGGDIVEYVVRHRAVSTVQEQSLMTRPEAMERFWKIATEGFMEVFS